jgi:hypothetical protein
MVEIVGVFFVPPDTPLYGVAMYDEFKEALSPKRHKPGPSSKSRNSDIPLNARQSEVDPGYMIEMSRMRPRTSHTAWRLSPNFFFRPHMNLPASHPTARQSFFEGLWIQIRIPSIAPAQQLKPALETFWNPWAILLSHPNPVGSSSTVATWYSRRYYLQSSFCQDLSAHPGPPMKSWAHPKPTPPLTQWVWVARGFGWAGSEIPISVALILGVRSTLTLTGYLHESYDVSVKCQNFLY